MWLPRKRRGNREEEEEEEEEEGALSPVACLLATPTVPSLGFFQDRFPSDLLRAQRDARNAKRMEDPIPRAVSIPKATMDDPVEATWGRPPRRRRRIAGDIDLQHGLVPSVRPSAPLARIIIFSAEGGGKETEERRGEIKSIVHPIH